MAILVYAIYSLASIVNLDKWTIGNTATVDIVFFIMRPVAKLNTLKSIKTSPEIHQVHNDSEDGRV